MDNYSYGGDDWDQGNRTFQGQYNNIIQEFAAEYNLSLAQIYFNMHYNNSFLLNDKLHPNDAGHALIAGVHNETYWANDSQSSLKWDVYSSVGNFTFMNYTFNMSQHPHETNTTLIIEDMQLYNFSVNTTQAVEVNTSARYSSVTQYDVKRTSLNGGASSTSVVTSDSSGKLQFTIPIGNYTYNISLYSASVPTTTEDSTSSGSASGTFRPSENALQNGWSVNIAKNQKVEISVGDEKKIVKVESVSKEKAVVSVDGNNYEIENSSSGKIDLDSDGFYDVEIVNNGVTGNYANLEFKLIHEEVPSDIEEGQNENIFDDVPDVIKSIDWKIYVLIGVIIVLIVIWFLLARKKK